jgi:hypothetical protein
MPTLAESVRAKYPGVYDDLSDTALEAKVDAKYPGVYTDIPRTKAAAAPAEKPRAYNPVTDFMAGPSFPIGVDPRPSAAVGAGGLALVGGMAVPGLTALATSPVGAGVTAGALDYLHTGSLPSAAKEALRVGLLTKGFGSLAGAVSGAGGARSLMTRIAQSGVARAAAEAAPAAVEGAPEASGAINILRGATRAAPAAAEVIPEAVAGESELAAQLRESIRQAAARQAGAPPGTPPSSILAAAGRNARMPVPATPQLATDVERKVLTLRQAQGLSRPQIAASIREMYGTSAADAGKMVDMILETYGVK